MICHLSLPVADLDRSRAFYDAALAPLGVVRLWDGPRGAGYGYPGGEDQLALFPASVVGAPTPIPAMPGLHVAFTAPDEGAVEAFHRAALAHGGSDEGAPGLRPRYGPGYHAAFVRDPDGHKLEAKRR